MSKNYDYWWAVILFFLLALALLTSCKTVRTTVKEDIKTDIVDTTKTVIDSTSYSNHTVDTTKIQTVINDSVSIELEDGTIEIKEDGTIIINKVKNIKGTRNTLQNIINGISAEEKKDSIHNEQHKGLTDKTKSKVTTKTEVWPTLVKIITTVICLILGLFFIGLLVRFICRLW